jgi:capsular exopolysaccharide synthesis family protein
VAEQLQQPGSLRDIQFSSYIRHYLNLLLRWKFYIVLTFPIVSLLALAFSFRFLVVTPELSATAMIGIEDPAAMTAVTDIGNIGQGRAELLTSRHFLQDVVKKLSLQLMIRKYPRHEIFDSVYVDTTAILGKYAISLNTKDGENYAIAFTNKKMGISKEIINAGRIADLSMIKCNGIYIKFANAFLKNPHEVKFSVVNMEDAIEDLYKRMAVQNPEAGNGHFNINVSVKGKDYQLITLSVNTITDFFIEKNLGFRKRKTQNSLGIFEKEYETAKQELSVSQAALEEFRTKNPTVGLSSDAQQTVGSLSSLETNTFDSKSTLTDAQTLRSRFAASSQDEKARIAGEILVFLIGKQEITAPVLQGELSQALAQQQELQRGNYALDHPRVIENRQKLENLESTIGVTLTNFIAGLGTKIESKETNIQKLSSEIRNLPSKELQLAALQRRQQVASDIFTTVLNRYNQAKVSEASEVSDFFVMDYAVPPIPPPGNFMKLIGICFMIGIIAAFAPVIFFDMIDQTVRTEFDFMRLTRRTVLECIPVIAPQKKKKKTVPSPTNTKISEDTVHILTQDLQEYVQNTEKEKPLITNESQPYYINEIFRSLRTKILLLFREKEDKSIIITSLEKGEGKSTMSANIALSLSQQNQRILLIDGDLRRGTLHEFFGLNQSPGLSEILASKELNDAPVSGALIRQTKMPNLFVITSGKPNMNSSELLSSPKFARIKETLSKKFDMIIFDAPPLGAVADAAIVNHLFGGYLIVVNAGTTNIIDLNKKIAEFPVLDKKLIGFILNRAMVDSRILYYKNSKYYNS